MASLPVTRKGTSTAERETEGYSPQSWEARLLAGSLRSVPVTLLYGGSAADRDALLLHGLMPLLGRRRADRPQPAKATCAPPLPAATGKLERSAPSPERVLMLDLAAEVANERVPLDSLARACEEMDAPADGAGGPGQAPSRLLLVLRGFESALQGAMQANARGAEPDPFWQTLTRRLKQPEPPPPAAPPPLMHLLLVTAEAATPALRWLGQALPCLGEHGLQLSDRPAARHPQLAAVSDLLGDVPHRSAAAGADDAEAVITEVAWRLAIQHAQERAGQPRGRIPACTAGRHSSETAAEPHGLPTQEPDAGQAGGAAATPLDAGPAAPPADVPPPADGLPPESARGHRLPSPNLMLALAAGAVLALALWGGRPGTQATSAADTAQRPSPIGATTLARTSLPAADDPAPALAAALAPQPLHDLRGGVAQALPALAPSPQPRLLLLRYDLLQVLPAARGGEGLAIVAPVFVEPLRVWVRADAPIRSWGELRRATIDIGRDGGDALTAETLRETLFGAQAPSVRLHGGDDADALAALQQGRVDALLRLRASALTAQAEAATARGALRELRLDGQDPLAPRAARRYLPLASPGYAAWHRPAVMSFLAVVGGDPAGRKRVAAEALARLCSALPRLRDGGNADWALVPLSLAPPLGRPYALPDAHCNAGTAPARDLQVADALRDTDRTPSPPPEKGSLR